MIIIMMPKNNHQPGLILDAQHHPSHGFNMMTGIMIGTRTIPIFFLI